MESVTRGSYRSIAYINGMSKNKTITAKVSSHDLSRINAVLSTTSLSKSAFIREAVLAIVGFLEKGGCDHVNDNGCEFIAHFQDLCKKLYNK